MSKKQGKSRSIKVRDLKNNRKPNFKPNRVKITLKEKLESIYNTSVCLNTTCQGKCECCKTAMPQMNFCEFTQILHEIKNTTSRSDQIKLVLTSIEYFFRNEFEKWGKESLIKPCLLLGEDGKCIFYSSRPLSCRLYGLWPEDVYNARVDKFEKAYSGLLRREDLPLNKQCPYVKRTDETILITEELIKHLYKQLDDLDQKVGNFTNLQISQKENYRSFHDWLLLKVFGEDWLVQLTQFMLSASRPIIEDQIKAIQEALRKKYAKEMPKLE